MAVDPGKFLCGLSVFKSGVLKHAKLVESSRTSGSGPAVWVAMAEAVRQTVDSCGLSPSSVAVEVMQVYRQGLQKGDQGDLVEVVGVSGAVCFAWPYARSHIGYRPAEWKGQVPKAVMKKRIIGALSEEEIGQIVICTPSLMHNVWDGIGIGLKAVGRL